MEYHTRVETTAAERDEKVNSANSLLYDTVYFGLYLKYTPDQYI